MNLTNSNDEFISVDRFVFNTIDYIVFFITLCVSAFIGIYFGFINKGADTTDEYLLGGKRMKIIPVAISLVASQLSAIAIMSIPAEMYSFGTQYIVIIVSMICVIPILGWIIIPVFYNNNISNCYEYLEMRFDKKTRQVVTLSFVITVYLLIPIVIFVSSLAFSQVTGINIHIINTVVCSVCVFYTMLGGIKAVIWTDVFQAGIMLMSCILVAYFGIIKVGSIAEVYKRADEGGRIILFDMKLDLTSRTTFWNVLLGSLFMFIGYIGLNQSSVQRIVSLPSLEHAQKSLGYYGVLYFFIMGLTLCTGVIMYARYYMCDPIKAGIVQKADKLMPFFVQDVVGHLKGMPGVFISCVFSASLSTMSANLNSLAGIVYFDYIRPYINHTEHRANLIMKFLVVISGIYCILGGFIVEQFSSILQMVITITGIMKGTVVGVFTLGMLYPRAHSKAAFSATIISMIILAWIIVLAQIAIKSGELKYDPLPTSIEGCDAYNITVIQEPNISNLHIVSNITYENPSITEKEQFSISKISFQWYSIIGTFLVLILGIILSHLLESNEDKKFNTSLISPISHFLIPKHLRQISLPQKEDVQGNIELTVLSQ